MSALSFNEQPKASRLRRLISAHRALLLDVHELHYELHAIRREHLDRGASPDSPIIRAIDSLILRVDSDPSAFHAQRAGLASIAQLEARGKSSEDSSDDESSDDEEHAITMKKLYTTIAQQKVEIAALKAQLQSDSSTSTHHPASFPASSYNSPARRTTSREIPGAPMRRTGGKATEAEPVASPPVRTNAGYFQPSSAPVVNTYAPPVRTNAGYFPASSYHSPQPTVRNLSNVPGAPKKAPKPTGTQARVVGW